MTRKAQIQHGPLFLDEPVEAAIDLSGLPTGGHIPVMALAFALGLALFLSVDTGKPWILLAIVALVGFGTDGIIRSHPKGHFKEIGDTSPFLFVPVLLALASGLFLKELVDGFWTVPVVVLAGCLMAAALYGEYASVDPTNASFPAGRFALNVLTYLTAFGFYAVVYSFDIGVLPSAFAVGMVSLLLSVEIFREAEADPYRSLAFAASIGWVLAETRWAMHFVPIDGFLAGGMLLLFFYLATGLVQHYLTGHLNRQIVLEFIAVTVAGTAIIVIGRLITG